MEIATEDTLVARFRAARRSAYQYRHRADWKRNLALAASMAALTGLLAQLRVVLPFTPVPITGQTFAVLLTGVVLGAKWGGLSQGIYTGAGLAGVPWFQQFGSGLSHLLGPTGGYIIGFVVAAIVVGFVIDRFPRARRLPHLFLLLLAANFLVIYAFGLPWLTAALVVGTGTTPGLVQILEMGLLPFVPGDIIKVIAATGVARLVLPAEMGDRSEGPTGT